MNRIEGLLAVRREPAWAAAVQKIAAPDAVERADAGHRSLPPSSDTPASGASGPAHDDSAPISVMARAQRPWSGGVTLPGAYNDQAERLRGFFQGGAEAFLTPLTGRLPSFGPGLPPIPGVPPIGINPAGNATLLAAACKAILQAADSLANYIVDQTQLMLDTVSGRLQAWMEAGNGLMEAFNKLLHGDVAGAVQTYVEHARQLVTDLARNEAAGVIRSLAAGADAIDRLLGTHRERPLTEREIEYLRRVYGDSIDYSQVRIVYGGTVREQVLGGHAVTLGNDIWISPQLSGSINADGSLTEQGLNLLAHESAHVWQFQNHGQGYIADSAYDQVTQGRGAGPGGAYDWLTPATNGVPFEDMRPEQQAQLAQVIDQALGESGQPLTRARVEQIVAQQSGSGITSISDQAWETVQRAQQVLHG